MTSRSKSLVGGALGLVWAIGVVWVGATSIKLPIFALTPTLLLVFLGPGFILGFMILWFKVRRLRSVESNNDPASESDTRVLRDTVEQTVLALCLWPAIGFLAADDGPGLLVALGIAFPVARFAYWVGFQNSPAVRVFGFTATFLPTFTALLWAVGIWLI